MKTINNLEKYKHLMLLKFPSNLKNTMGWRSYRRQIKFNTIKYKIFTQEGKKNRIVEKDIFGGKKEKNHGAHI